MVLLSKDFSVNTEQSIPKHTHNSLPRLIGKLNRKYRLILTITYLVKGQELLAIHNKLLLIAEGHNSPPVNKTRSFQISRFAKSEFLFEARSSTDLFSLLVGESI